jgi:hypothetical protein
MSDLSAHPVERPVSVVWSGGGFQLMRGRESWVQGILGTESWGPDQIERILTIS